MEISPKLVSNFFSSCACAFLMMLWRYAEKIRNFYVRFFPQFKVLDLENLLQNGLFWFQMEISPKLVSNFFSSCACAFLMMLWRYAEKIRKFYVRFFPQFKVLDLENLLQNGQFWLEMMIHVYLQNWTVTFFLIV